MENMSSGPKPTTEPITSAIPEANIRSSETRRCRCSCLLQQTDCVSSWARMTMTTEMQATCRSSARPHGWAIFLHPAGSGDSSAVVYFLDDGRSYVMPGTWRRIDATHRADRVAAADSWVGRVIVGRQALKGRADAMAELNHLRLRQEWALLSVHELRLLMGRSAPQNLRRRFRDC